MFSSANLYNLFKPEKNPDLITDYDVIIGGTLLTANFDKGAIILNLISSNNVTSQYKDFLNPIVSKKENEEESEIITEASIKEYSYIQSNYQIDIYKVNPANVNYIEVEIVALKIREWLKSLETIEYLKTLHATILPCYSNINYTSELYNKKFVNRAFFDFSIISIANIKEAVDAIEKVLITENLIYGGLNGK